MNRSHHFIGIALAFVAACAKDKPAADTKAATSPATAMPAPDTMKATAPSVPDSVKLMTQANTKGAASKGTPATLPPKVAAKQPIIGRDSVRIGPIIGIPSIKDTAKRKPPR